MDREKRIQGFMNNATPNTEMPLDNLAYANRIVGHEQMDEPEPIDESPGLANIIDRLEQMRMSLENMRQPTPEVAEEPEPEIIKPQLEELD
jgi:hypothetical protein